MRLAEAQAPNRAPTKFAVSHRPAEDAGWLELLASGLTFDLTGLAPAKAAPIPACGTPIGLAEDVTGENLEAVRLDPGAHLSGGEAMLPIVRVHLALALVLASLPNVAALAWHPARTWVEPAYFVRTVSAWLDGGAFPALGLTALTATGDGGLVSEGLAFFIGRELKVAGGLVADGAETAKLAMRLIHHMVEAGRDNAAGPYVTEQGQTIEVRESDDDRYLEARQAGA